MAGLIVTLSRTKTPQG